MSRKVPRRYRGKQRTYTRRPVMGGPPPRGPRSESQISPYPPPPDPRLRSRGPPMSRPARVDVASTHPRPHPPRHQPTLHPTTRPQLAVGSAPQHGAHPHRGLDHAHLSAEEDTAHARRGSWWGRDRRGWVAVTGSAGLGYRNARFQGEADIGIPTSGSVGDFGRLPKAGIPALAQGSPKNSTGQVVRFLGGGAVWWCGFKPSAPLASRLNHTTSTTLMYRYIHGGLFFLGWCGPFIPLYTSRGKSPSGGASGAVLRLSLCGKGFKTAPPTAPPPQNSTGASGAVSYRSSGTP